MSSQDRLVELLEELLLWTRVGSYSAVKDILHGALDDDKKKQIYALADGTRTAEQVRQQASVSPNKVLECFKNWERVGILTTLPNGNRKHMFDPTVFGILAAGGT